MSLLIVWTDRDRALVAVDTQGVICIAPGPGLAPVRLQTVTVSKLFPFVAAGVVLACRGATDYLATLLALCSAKHWAGFDEFEQGLPSVLAVVEEAVRRRYLALGFSAVPDLARIEVCIVGRSESANRMRAQMFVRTTDASGFVPEPIEQEYVQPWIWFDNDPDPPLPSSIAEIERIARAQADWCERTTPGASAVGGRLIVAELASNGDVRISNVRAL